MLPSTCGARARSVDFGADARLFGYTMLYIVSTTRNLTFPVIIRLYASATLESGYFSIIGRTPVIALNRNVSSESLAVPEGQPSIDRLQAIKSRALIVKGSIAAATIRSFPSADPLISNRGAFRLQKPRQPGDFRKLTFRRRDEGSGTNARYHDGTVRMLADE